MVFALLMLQGCVFVYNCDNSEINIDDNDTPNIKTTLPIKGL